MIWNWTLKKNNVGEFQMTLIRHATSYVDASWMYQLESCDFPTDSRLTVCFIVNFEEVLINKWVN